MRSVYNILFVCFSWTVSVIAGVISNKIRGNPTEADALQKLATSGFDCGTMSQAECLQLAIFNGVFLEAGPTVVYAVFFALAAAILLWVKQRYKQYVFSCIFAMICLVITMSYGPLFPYFNGSLGVFFIVLGLMIVNICHSEYILCTN